jgi:hypothetical protein
MKRLHVLLAAVALSMLGGCIVVPAADYHDRPRYYHDRDQYYRGS